MPIPDPRAGRAFVWMVSCFLFISIAAGGSFLAMYIILPESQIWFAIVGVTLVCLPWVFWIFTCLYRFLSRSCGFRMIIGGGGDHVGGGGGSVGICGGNSHANNNNIGNSSKKDKNLNFDEAVVSSQDSGGGGGGSERGRSNKETKNRKGSSSSSGHSSMISHESEKPLALSTTS